MQPRPIELAGRPLAQGDLPAICAPLVARDVAALAAETSGVAAKKPDLLEWRADFFEGFADAQRVLEAARMVHLSAAGIPLLFTRRAQREGGQPLAASEEQVLAVYDAVCASGLFALADFEMENDAAHVRRMRETTRRHGVGLVLSFHDFSATPAREAIVARLAQAARLGADVAKVAVMPRSPEDVLTLLQATLEASRSLPIPVVSMSMGSWGALSRVCGGMFGSALTFAVGASASAPGQMPIEDVRTAVAVLRRALSAG